MPVKALKFAPGVKRNGTSYAAEGGWYDCDKIRFRSGTPEKIGGWQRISANEYLGVCRLLFPWSTLTGDVYLATGTNLKMYVCSGGAYNDITPLRGTATLNNPFDTTDTLTTVTVHDVAHGAITGDFVTFSGAAAVGGLDLNNEYQITYVDADTYTITASSPATSTVVGGGGATVSAAYQITTGPATPVPLSGWGSGSWGSGSWGSGSSTTNSLQIWNASNFGEDLVYGPRGAGVYYWDSSSGLTTRGVALSALPGAADTPDYSNFLLVSDVSRFVILFGTDSYADPGVMDPMLIRWSDQESAAVWTPGATTKAGELRLSHGSEIITAVQTRQEIVVYTDTSVYSLQYNDAPVLWGATLLADNTSIMSSRAAVAAGSAVFWMGNGKFYLYDGQVRTLDCDVLNYVFHDFNRDQFDQVFASTNEEFGEIWWFYCSADATTVDSYVVYNFTENIWYFGRMERTAWVDSGVFPYPIAAVEETNNLVYHEYGADDDIDGDPAGIEAYLETAQFDLDDGDRFAFITKMFPDVSFANSTAASPAITMTIKPMKGSGSGYNSPLSVGGQSAAAVTRSTTVPIEAYTDQIYVRARGRQMVIRFESSGLGVMWQIGVPRMLVRQDGRRG